MPRSLFVGLGAAVLVSALVGVVAVAAFPAVTGSDSVTTRLATDWIQAPLVGIVSAFNGHMPALLVDILRVMVGLTGAGVLLAAATTSISGVGRVVYSLGRHQMLPHTFGTFGRRSTLPPAAILGAAAVSIALVIVSASVGREARFLASLYSFGVLITFAIAQAAVVRLRFTEPDLPRPYVVPLNVRIRGRPVPVAALLGIPLVVALWVVSFSHARRREDRRARLAARRRRALRRSARPPRGGAAGARRRPPTPGPRARRARASTSGSSSRQARADRRGDARDRDQARRGARRHDPRAARDPRPALAAARRRGGRPGGARERVAGGCADAGRGARRDDRGRHRPRARDRRGDRREGGARSAPT